MFYQKKLNFGYGAYGEIIFCGEKIPKKLFPRGFMALIEEHYPSEATVEMEVSFCEDYIDEIQIDYIYFEEFQFDFSKFSPKLLKRLNEAVTEFYQEADSSNNPLKRQAYYSLMQDIREF